MLRYTSARLEFGMRSNEKYAFSRCLAQTGDPLTVWWEWRIKIQLIECCYLSELTIRKTSGGTRSSVRSAAITGKVLRNTSPFTIYKKPRDDGTQMWRVHGMQRFMLHWHHTTTSNQEVICKQSLLIININFICFSSIFCYWFLVRYD